MQGDSRSHQPAADDQGILVAYASGLPLHLPKKQRFNTTTLKGIRSAMGQITSATAHGRLDPEAGRTYIWMLREVATVLEKERATEALHAKLDKLQRLITETAPELGREIDVAAITADVRQAIDGANNQ